MTAIHETAYPRIRSNLGFFAQPLVRGYFSNTPLRRLEAQSRKCLMHPNFSDNEKMDL